jgi:hypothetical protein
VEDAARVVVNTVMNAVHLRYIANFGVSLGRCRSLVAWWFVSVRERKFARTPNFDQKN